MTTIIYLLLMCWPPYREAHIAAAEYFDGFVWAAGQIRYGYPAHTIAIEIECGDWATPFDYGALAAINTITNRRRHAWTTTNGSSASST